MKKITEKLLALLLITVTLFSISAQSISAGMTEETETVQTYDQPTLRLSGAAVGSAAAKYLVGRIYQEASSYVISNDVPLLGGMAKLMLNPSQRAALKQSAQVSQILSTVTAMEQSLTEIQTQLTQISAKLSTLETEIKKLQQQVNKLQWEVEALSQKTDLQHAANLLNQSIQNMNSTADKYTTAWKAYSRFIEATENLAKKKEEREKTTDADKIALLDKEIDELNTAVDDKLNAFINVIGEGGGMPFASDIGVLENAIWNPDNPSSSYLGAYEDYLRLAYPFEHQITDKLSSAMTSCACMVEHIFTMYQEYYSYMKYSEELKNAGDPSAINPYGTYTDSYFMSQHDDILDFIVDMAETSGVASYMVATKLSAETVEECKKLDPDFKEPECIDSYVYINGTTYRCYKVRSNSDLNYYLIFKNVVEKDQFIQTSSMNYFSGNTLTVCRPSFVMDHEYTDNGKYRLISSSDLPDFITKAYDSVLSHLRVDGELWSIPQNMENIILLDNSCSGVKGSNVVWNVKAVNAADWGGAGTVNINTGDVKDGKAGNNAIAVYRMVSSDDNYNNSDKTYQVKDKSEIQNKILIVDSGQTLDLTKLTVDLNNITINVVGNGTINSTPKITLNNSRINIYNGAEVTIIDLNIKAKKGDTAAVMVVEPQATIHFQGTNNIYGTSTGSNNAVDYYVNCVPGNPIGASHGLYASDKTKIDVSGTTKCVGADGGAGVCVSGKIEIQSTDNGKLIANGSSSSVKNQTYFPMTIGAGIGGSVSVAMEKTTVIQNSASRTCYTKRSGGSSDYIGSNAQIYTTLITVDASGATVSNINASNGGSSITFTSDDIGGVNAAGTDYGVKGGKLTKTTVNNANQRISSAIETKNNNNIINPEVYTIKVYTHGKDGVTKKGVQFKLHGTNGSTGWINASNCGNKKGWWTGTYVANSVGTISSVEVKTNNSNNWFPGEISVSTKYGGESITVYGGRWIGTSSKTLRPEDKIYKVTINTGTVKDSGTNSDIYLQLRDNNGKTSDKYQLDSIHYDNDAFEKGDTTDFWLYAPSNFGTCDGVYLSSDHSGVGPDWKVDKIYVKNVQGGSGESFTFSAGYWFRINQTVYFGRYSGKTGAYYIEVKTSNVKKAGTDSDIYLTVNGSNGKNSGAIDIGAMADDGDNFERGDTDTMCIGYNVTALGDINSLTIKKNNSGPGPDWHLEYIIIKEIVSDEEAKNAKSYKFTWNKWIENETVKLTSRQKTGRRQSVVRLDREILSQLTTNSDGSYTLTVDREITLSEDVLELLSEKSAVLNIVMENDDKILYEITFDGSTFDSAVPVVLGKDYSFADGKSLFDFMQELEVPDTTKIRLHTQNIGFLGSGRYSVFAKDDDGNWQKIENVIDSDGIIEFYAQKVKELMLIDKQNAWTVTPNIEDWVCGEQVPDIEGESLYGDYTVRYTGTADDGTSYDSSVVPEKAGKYTAVFTVEATDTYEGLTYEVEFNVTAPADDTAEGDITTVPDENTTVPDESTTKPDEITTGTDETTADKSKDTTTDVSDAKQTKESNLTWLWITITAVVAFAAGATVCGIVLRKKEK